MLINHRDYAGGSPMEQRPEHIEPIALPHRLPNLDDPLDDPASAVDQTSQTTDDSTTTKASRDVCTTGKDHLSGACR